MLTFIILVSVALAFTWVTAGWIEYCFKRRTGGNNARVIKIRRQFIFLGSFSQVMMITTPGVNTLIGIIPILVCLYVGTRFEDKDQMLPLSKMYAYFNYLVYFFAGWAVLALVIGAVKM